MRRFRYVLILLVSVLWTGSAIAAEPEPVPLYTNDDLLRMFGPSDEPMEPVRAPRVDLDLIERVIARAYERAAADRRWVAEPPREGVRDWRRVLGYPYWGFVPRFGVPGRDHDHGDAGSATDGCGHGAACDWDGRDAVPGPPSPRARRHGDPVRQPNVQRTNPSRGRGLKLGHKKKAGR